MYSDKSSLLFHLSMFLWLTCGSKTVFEWQIFRAWSYSSSFLLRFCPPSTTRTACCFLTFSFIEPTLTVMNALPNNLTNCFMVLILPWNPCIKSYFFYPMYTKTRAKFLPIAALSENKTIFEWTYFFSICSASNMKDFNNFPYDLRRHISPVIHNGCLSFEAIE